MSRSLEEHGRGPARVWFFVVEVEAGIIVVLMKVDRLGRECACRDYRTYFGLLGCWRYAEEKKYRVFLEGFQGQRVTG